MQGTLSIGFVAEFPSSLNGAPSNRSWSSVGARMDGDDLARRPGQAVHSYRFVKTLVPMSCPYRLSPMLPNPGQTYQRYMPGRRTRSPR
jgi:hypothetical protein